jgi:ABC-type transport system substrate-binding protein
MDALLDAQAGELDEAARVALLGEVQDLWATEVPFTPLGQGALYVAYNDNVSNFILDPLSLAHYFLIEKK